jgi:hypothetical protein
MPLSVASSHLVSPAGVGGEWRQHKIERLEADAVRRVSDQNYARLRRDDGHSGST